MAYGKMKINLIEKTVLTINRFSFQAGNMVLKKKNSEKIHQSNVRLSMFHKAKVKEILSSLKEHCFCVYSQGFCFVVCSESLNV